jgi:hypothetical protein
MKTKLMYFAALLFTFSFYEPLFSQNPVVGATISVELESDGQHIANVVTNNMGEFAFTIQGGIVIPDQGNFLFNITTPVINSSGETTNEMEEQTISTHFVKKIDGPRFKYVLTRKNSKAQSKGAFAVSGKSDAIMNPQKAKPKETPTN